MDYPRDVPENNVQTKTIEIAAHQYVAVSEQLLANKHVLRIEVQQVGSKIQITVHYAVMDLVLQLASISHTIEQLAQSEPGS